MSELNKGKTDWKMVTAQFVFIAITICIALYPFVVRIVLSRPLDSRMEEFLNALTYVMLGPMIAINTATEVSMSSAQKSTKKIVRGFAILMVLIGAARFIKLYL